MSRKVLAGSLLKEVSSGPKASAQYRLKTETGSDYKRKTQEAVKPPSFLESSNSKMVKTGSKNLNSFLKQKSKLEPTFCQTEHSNALFSSRQKLHGLGIEANSPKSDASDIQTKVKPGDHTERTNLSQNNNQSQQQKAKNNLQETHGSTESGGFRTGLLFDRKNQTIAFKPFAHMNNLRLDSSANGEENETQLFLKK